MDRIKKDNKGKINVVYNYYILFLTHVYYILRSPLVSG